ncbi:hypothetical protein M9458_054006, partial [Cirrhinus mrigala]
MPSGANDEDSEVLVSAARVNSALFPRPVLQPSKVSEFTSSMRAGDDVGPSVLKDDVVAVKDNECVHGSACGSKCNDGELMEDCDNCSEFSEIDCSQSSDDVYSVEELNEFLDLTKGKKADVVNFFPDVNKFIKSVVIAQKK